MAQSSWAITPLGCGVPSYISQDSLPAKESATVGAQTMRPPVLSAEDLSKSFPGVTALQHVSFDLCQGEILGLVGENGAGKSTLAKILMGIYQPDSGLVKLDGQPTIINSPSHALAKGLAIVHQEVHFFPNLGIRENLLIENLPTTRRMRRVDWSALDSVAREWLNQMNLGVLDPCAKMATLTPPERQLVEIARAMLKQPRILIMDEPTTSLSRPDINRLSEMLRALCRRGVSIIFISHHIVDTLSLCDRVVILRDGRKVGDHPISSMTLATVVREMVGREIGEQYPKATIPIGEVQLSVQHLSHKGVGLSDVCLEVRKGEIVGVTGQTGSGKTSVAECMFGGLVADAGVLSVAGREYNLADASPDKSLRRHIGYVPEDRKQRGLVMALCMGNNISLSVLDAIKGQLGYLRRGLERVLIKRSISDLSITPSDPQRLVRYLSGGNSTEGRSCQVVWYGASGADP